jgi:LacI family transcriptional regulator
MPRSAVTVREIARHAGVSASTVSRVLTGSTPVAPSKRAAVLAAAESLRYRPLATSRSERASRAIGILAPQLTDTFHSRILVGIDRSLRETGYYSVLATGDTPQERARAMHLFTSHPVDAVAVVGGFVPDADLRGLAERMPLVAVGRTIEGLEERCILAANFQGGYEATRYLIDLGHRRIAHIMGNPSHADSRDRREGYIRALADAGIPFHPWLVVEGDFEEKSGFDAVESLMAARVPFTAVFAGNDQMAWGAGLALFRRKLRVPQDVSLVGFDDEPKAAFTWPPLTTVRQPTLEMGQAAMRALLDDLEGRPFSAPSFATELVVRESSAPPARVPSRRSA